MRVGVIGIDFKRLLKLKDGFVNPEILAWHQSGAVLLMLILGGIGTLRGAVLGAFLFGLHILFCHQTRESRGCSQDYLSCDIDTKLIRIQGQIVERGIFQVDVINILEECESFLVRFSHHTQGVAGGSLF